MKFRSREQKFTLPNEITVWRAKVYSPEWNFVLESKSLHSRMKFRSGEQKFTLPNEIRSGEQKFTLPNEISL